MNTASAPISPSFQPPRVFGFLDDLLRRRAACFTEIMEGKDVPRLLVRYFTLTMCLTALYGLTMGGASLLSDPLTAVRQMGASAIKLPILYILTTLICFPILYMVIAMMGSRLTFLQTLATIFLALSLNALLLAGFAPMVWFFTITGANYVFVKLLHVSIMGLSGLGGMIALWHGLKMACEQSQLLPAQAVRILQVWILVFGFVGTQMAWSLRPYVGDPEKPFELIRSDREGNFYQAVVHSVVDLVKENR